MSGATGPTANFQTAMECFTGTVSYTQFTNNSTSQEITIHATMSQKWRFHHLILNEATQFTAAGVSSLTVSAGTQGTDTDVVPVFALKQAGANYWLDRPGIPAGGLGTSTWNFVLQFIGASALSTGGVTNFSAGSLTYEGCGFKVQ